MYEYEVKPLLDKKLAKLTKKNPALIHQLDKKIHEILLHPHHFKPLRGSLKNTRRVHVASSFVLLFDIDDEKRLITLLDMDHHDNIYE